jgi:hypothetical protein
VKQKAKMNIFESKNFQIFKAERLVFEIPKKPEEAAPATPEKETPKEEKPGVLGVLEKDKPYQKTKGYLKDKKKIDDAFTKRKATILGETPEEIVENEKDLKTKSKSYFEQIEKGDPAAMDKLHKKALSEEVSYADLQGGWEWLGLKEEEQEQKYTRMAQIYLDKETSSGQVTFRIKDKLNDSHKTMYGVGAGDLLPPSVKAVEIETPDGQFIRGTRKIVGGRVGYYDENGTYIPVFGGYKLKPIEFIDEKSDEYKTQVEAEKKNYIETRDQKNAFHEASSTMDEDEIAHRTSDPEEDPGRTSHPVTSLQSLESATPDSLADADLDQAEVAEAINVQEDYKKIKSLIDVFGIRMSAQSDIDGGASLMQLKGKGAEKMGWKEEHDSKQTELMEKLSNKDFIKEEIAKWPEGQNEGEIEGIKVIQDTESEDGYSFKNRRGQKAELEECVLENIAMSVSENETVEFIKAMQNGGGAEFMGHKFIGNYNFEIGHLAEFHSLTKEDPGKLREHLEKAKELSDPIDPAKLVEIIFKRDVEEGMSYDEAMKIIRKTPGMRYLADGPEALQLSPLVQKARERMRKGMAITEVNYNFDNYAGELDYPLRGGSNCCAAEVSTALGVTKLRQSVNRNCVPDLIAGNLERTGKEGIVIGFENFKKGDVVVFAGNKSKVFTHVGIVRDRLTIDGEDYLAIQHDFGDLQVDIVPVNGRSSAWKRHQKMLRSRSGRAQLAQQSPELASIIEYRKKYPKTVRFRNNRYFQDASQGRGGNIAFAVRTETLLPKES